MKNEFSQESLKKAYLALADGQKEILDEHVKRGKKTKWLNAWAIKKGSELTAEDLDDPEKAMENMLEWILLDYEDAMAVSPDLRCECGRPLRYRYTVLHKSSGRTYYLGVVHFEQHTGLTPEIVRLIQKGLNLIDLERDEILSKVIKGWKLPFPIPKDLEIPKDMVDQLNADLPLLDRQVKRLHDVVWAYNSRKYEVKPSISSGPRITKNRWEKPTNGDRPNRVDASPKRIDFSTPSKSFLSAQESLAVDLSRIHDSIAKAQLSAPDAMALFSVLKHCPQELQRQGLTVDQVKSTVMRALGRISNPEIRYWLVEIENL